MLMHKAKLCVSSQMKCAQFKSYNDN
uniref:Uncharacterized protein n=1 Tax=Arundo donax TaxID=35708 RepID=A0A0A9FP17_ARUDO